MPWTPFDLVVALAFCCKLKFEEVSVFDCMTDKLEEVNCIRSFLVLGNVPWLAHQGVVVKTLGGFRNPE